MKIVTEKLEEKQIINFFRVYVFCCNGLQHYHYLLKKVHAICFFEISPQFEKGQQMQERLLASL